MNILITGGTGFIGKKLGVNLVKNNHKLFVLLRDKKKKTALPYACTFVDWNDLNDITHNKKIEIHSIVNLAGESIAQRWNDKVKRDILNSRVDTTARLIKLFKGSNLKSFISASAIGIYGDRKGEPLNEKSESGTGFLTRVCVEWEREALKIEEATPKARAVILRFGMVLGEGEGALAKMTPVFQRGIGGMIGDGKMWISWIDVEDLVSMITWTIENESVKGIYNAVSPNPVTNKEFSEKLAAKFNKKLFLPVPKLAVKILFGEMSQVVLASQKVQSKKIEQEGFRFKHPELAEALKVH